MSKPFFARMLRWLIPAVACLFLGIIIGWAAGSPPHAPTRHVHDAVAPAPAKTPPASLEGAGEKLTVIGEKLEKALQEKSRLKRELETSAKQITEIASKVDSLKNDMAEEKERADKLALALKNKNEDVKNANRIGGKLQKDLDKERVQVSKLKAKNESLRRLSSDVKKKLADDKDKIKLLSHDLEVMKISLATLQKKNRELKEAAVIAGKFGDDVEYREDEEGKEGKEKNEDEKGKEGEEDEFPFDKPGRIELAFNALYRERNHHGSDSESQEILLEPEIGVVVRKNFQVLAGIGLYWLRGEEKELPLYPVVTGGTIPFHYRIEERYLEVGGRVNLPLPGLKMFVPFAELKLGLATHAEWNRIVSKHDWALFNTLAFGTRIFLCEDKKVAITAKLNIHHVNWDEDEVIIGSRAEKELLFGFSFFF